jgi:NADH-quinone oxidoreductase subunit E
MTDTTKKMKERLFGAKRREAGSEIAGAILDRYRREATRVIAILQDLQAEFGYLPQGELRFVADQLDLPLSRVYGIATFYKAFSLTPRGRREIRLCLGTACHVRGGVHIKEAIERELGIEEGGTTNDLAFSFETVRCLGCCGQAPVMMIDEEIVGKLKATGIGKLLEKYR